MFPEINYESHYVEQYTSMRISIKIKVVLENSQGKRVETVHGVSNSA